MSEGARVIVTGRGVASPVGCDWQTFAKAVGAGTIAPSTPFPNGASEGAPLFHPLSESPPEGKTGGGREPLATLATQTARQALLDAAIDLESGPLDDVGFVMNTATT